MSRAGRVISPDADLDPFPVPNGKEVTAEVADLVTGLPGADPLATPQPK